MWYNQLWDNELKNSCSVLAFLDFLKYEYYIDVSRDSIVVLLNWLEKAMVFSRLWWAAAGKVYPAIQRYIRWKYDLEMRIEVWNINQINDGKWHLIAYKWANKLYLSFTADKVVTRKEIDKMKATNWHFVYYENWVVADNLGGILIKWSYEDIIYAYEKGLFYYNTRRFSAGDDKTQAVLEKAKAIWQAREKNKFERPFISPQELKNLWII